MQLQSAHYYPDDLIHFIKQCYLIPPTDIRNLSFSQDTNKITLTHIADPIQWLGVNAAASHSLLTMAAYSNAVMKLTQARIYFVLWSELFEGIISRT